MESAIQRSHVLRSFNSFTNIDSNSTERRQNKEYQNIRAPFNIRSADTKLLSDVPQNSAPSKLYNDFVDTGFPRIEQSLHGANAAGEAFTKLEAVSGSVFFDDDKLKIKICPIPKFKVGDTRSCTPLFVYPKSSIPGNVCLIYIQCSAFIDSDFVKNFLKAKGVIGGIISDTPTKHAFLSQTARFGQYKIRTMSGIATVFVTPYERTHMLHRGRFAIGLPKFFCGLNDDQEYRVIVRGESSSGVQFVVSRSYTGDCVGLQQENGLAERRGRGGINNIKEQKANECVNFSQEEPKTLALKSWRRDIVNDQKELFEQFFHLNLRNETSSRNLLLPDIEINYKLCPKCGIVDDKLSLLFTLGVFLMKNDAQLNLTMFPCKFCKKSVFDESTWLCSAALRPVRQYNNRETDFAKYYHQRFRLISLYRKDINLTPEAWFSICPEEIAKHIARRIAGLSQIEGQKIRVLDPFCGAGGNIIQVARLCEVEMVYAFDINPQEIRSLKLMAEIYKVKNKVKFGVKNFFDLYPEDLPKIHAIVSSPPWGGPGYFIGKYDLASMRPSYDAILAHASRFSGNIAMLLPRNTCLDQIIRSGERINSAGIELELNFMKEKPKTATAYYGNIVNLK